MKDWIFWWADLFKSLKRKLGVSIFHRQSKAVFSSALMKQRESGSALGHPSADLVGKGLLRGPRPSCRFAEKERFALLHRVIDAALKWPQDYCKGGSEL